MAKFQVTVTDVSHGTLVPLVKSLRLVATLSLKDAKNLVDFMVTTQPCTLAAGLDQDVADHILALLQEAGATAVVTESSLSVPLLLCPRANQRYRWGWSGGQVMK